MAGGVGGPLTTTKLMERSTQATVCKVCFETGREISLLHIDSKGAEIFLQVPRGCPRRQAPLVWYGQATQSCEDGTRKQQAAVHASSWVRISYTSPFCTQIRNSGEQNGRGKDEEMRSTGLRIECHETFRFVALSAEPDPSRDGPGPSCEEGSFTRRVGAFTRRVGALI